MKTQHKKIIRKTTWVLLIIYLICMTYFLFFSEWLNRTSFGPEYRYNLTLFREVKRSFWCLRAGDTSYFILNFILNIVAFVPFGFFLPILSKKRYGKKFLYTFFSTLQFTLIIELCQLFMKVGTFDVDDIFLNTIGGVIGYLCYIIVYGVFLLMRKVKKHG